MCPAVDWLDGLAAQEGPSVSEDVRTGSPTSGAVPDTVPNQVVAAPVDQAKRHLVLIILTLSVLVDRTINNQVRTGGNPEEDVRQGEHRDLVRGRGMYLLFPSLWLPHRRFSPRIHSSRSKDPSASCCGYRSKPILDDSGQEEVSKKVIHQPEVIGLSLVPRPLMTSQDLK